ncbi:Predicted ATPase [Pseudomonas asplenii]|uniref:Predicted ATPase n=1 Tax=Pseudomonas asplenii TaxID=53407 RepID=A0A1H2A085_9PSED|nr:AAA family ATPase [Pseudomonas asplenii]SDT39374.1 Predicted ATPase [Pseudomonas asplenii]
MTGKRENAGERSSIGQPAEEGIRLCEFKIDNFKSLVGFEMQLANFTCLIGLNGAGKSTILQALDFLSQQIKGDFSGWLKKRDWKPIDLKSKLSKSSNIKFEAVFDVDGQRAVWKASFNRTFLRCTEESWEIDETTLWVGDGRLATYEKKRGILRGLAGPMDFDYQGSVLSVLKESRLPPVILRLKKFISSITSLDALSPQYLRKQARGSDGDLGFAGEKLSAFIHQLAPRELGSLLAMLKNNYPALQSIELKSLNSGWKSLAIQETYTTGTFSTQARHMNDGMLRLMAILAETLSRHGFMLFDEVENGINPELIEFLLDYLVSLDRQVMVTTHSPMILNYLEDDIALEGVQLIYKTDDGRTRTIPFFSIPSVAEKLTVMGPGEVFVDTDLVRLPQEIERWVAR